MRHPDFDVSDDYFMEALQTQDGTIEYRVWNPFHSKLAAAVLSGVDNIWIFLVLCCILVLLLAQRCHVPDIVGLNGLVYAVEFSHRSGRDLVNLAKRTNVIPIIEDARHPAMYQVSLCRLLERLSF